MAKKSGDSWNRRTVLGAVASGAVGVTTLASAASAASSDDRITASGEEIEPDRVVEDLSEVEPDCWGCTTYSKCTDPCYVDGGIVTEELHQRTCCICSGDTVCTDWQGTGKCCPEQ